VLVVPVAVVEVVLVETAVVLVVLVETAVVLVVPEVVVVVAAVVLVVPAVVVPPLAYETLKPLNVKVCVPLVVIISKPPWQLPTVPSLR
jgi:hypothetical protein